MSDINEEQKRLYKRAEENDIKLLKEKIEEILDIFTKYKDDWYSVEYTLKPKQCVALYDYITNLQEENNRLNNIINRTIKYVESLSSSGRGCDIYEDIKKEILNILKGDNK